MTWRTAGTLLARNVYRRVAFEVMTVSDAQQSRGMRTSHGAADASLEVENATKTGATHDKARRRRCTLAAMSVPLRSVELLLTGEGIIHALSN
jgi:hypothetical protein